MDVEVDDDGGVDGDGVGDGRAEEGEADEGGHDGRAAVLGSKEVRQAASIIAVTSRQNDPAGKTLPGEFAEISSIFWNGLTGVSIETEPPGVVAE